MTSRFDNLIVKIISDDTEYKININKLLKYQDSLICKVYLENLSDELVFTKNKCIYIDIDPKSLDIIIKYLRGYPVESILEQNNSVLNMVLFDADRLILTDLKEQINKLISNEQSGFLEHFDKYSPNIVFDLDSNCIDDDDNDNDTDTNDDMNDGSEERVLMEVDSESESPIIKPNTEKKSFTKNIDKTFTKL